MEEIFNRKLTINDIQKINEIRPKYISVSNKKWLTSDVLSQLDDSIQIRVVDINRNETIVNNSLQEKGKETKLSGDIKASEEVFYTKSELLNLIDTFEIYEKSINPNWSDLEKALYVYSRMIFEYNNSSVDFNEVYSYFSDPSKELSRRYQDMMERLDIPCTYNENLKGYYAWNEIELDGVYFPVDLNLDLLISNEAGANQIIVHNFGKNREFYSVPEHSISDEDLKSKRKFLDPELVQQSLTTVVDQLLVDESNRIQAYKPDIKIDVKSKELKGVFKNDTITLETSLMDSPLQIALTDNNFGELIQDLKSIGIYYPEIVQNIEILNGATHHIDMQEVVDGIFDAVSVDVGRTITPINLTISSNYEEDFNLDFSKAPRLIKTNTSYTNVPDIKSKVSLKNISTKFMKAPSINSSNLSENIEILSFEGFDVDGLDLRNSNIRNIEFIDSFNLGGVVADRDYTYAISLEAVTQNELNNALSNFAIHDLRIRNVNLIGRPILHELSVNPELVKIYIHDCHLDNIDGLEDFDGRLYELFLGGNDLSIDDLERVETFKQRNPLLVNYYLHSNSQIDNTISSLPEISDETFNYLVQISKNTTSNFTIYNKKDAINYLLWTHYNTPYYIKDAAIIRDGLKINANPMLVENNTELENIDFNEPYLRNGTLLLTPAQIDYLIWLNKPVPQNIRVKIENVSELSTSELNSLLQRAGAIGLNIDSIQIIDENKFNNSNQIAVYSLGEYTYIRDMLDVVVNGINPSDSDIDKFATIYKRLMHNITYDDEACKDGNAQESKYYAEKENSSRNLYEGLTESKCVCSGYADILRNALSLVGIEAQTYSGYTGRDSSGKETGHHSWNRVKLDDGSGNPKWYHVDLTWAAGNRNHYMDYTLRGENSSFKNAHYQYPTNIPTVSPTDFDRQLLQDAMDRVNIDDFELALGQEIDIPEDPVRNISILDRDRILNEYNRRKNDMLAKYYGDKDYRREYMERSHRFRVHEIETNDGTISYRTIEDYPEKYEDEQFLLLDKYAECLERMTKYEAGDTSVYSGTPDQINDALEKDRQYVQTRNHTFNKNQDVRNSLATLGKYGERVPYIPKQDNIIKNIGRVALNAGIFTRNLVAPVYRGIGRYIAQPIHQLVVRNKDASPFRNNWYHRMVARRDYFTEHNNSIAPGHTIRNAVKSRFEAIFNAEEGNKAVLNAGAYEIQENIVAQERERNLLFNLNNQSSEYGRQIRDLQQAITANPTAKNIDKAKKALQDKIVRKQVIDNKISIMEKSTIGISQTDAISDAQHDVAVKEEITMKTTVIKGFVKGLTAKFVGPKIHEWLRQRGTKTITEETTNIVPEVKERYVPTTYKTQPETIYQDQIDTTKTLAEMMETNSGKTVTGFYSVYGGERGAESYVLSGNESITAIFQAKGNVGNGLSDIVGLKAPTLVDGTFDTSMLTSSGLLDNSITVNKLLEAISNGSVDINEIENMYVSIGDKYWTKLSNLTHDLIAKVPVGTEIKSVVDVPGHFEPYIDYVEKPGVVIHTITDDRFIRLSKAAEIAFPTGLAADGVIDVAENIRNTGTNVTDNKLQPKDYSFDDGTDMPANRRAYRRHIENER